LDSWFYTKTFLEDSLIIDLWRYNTGHSKQGVYPDDNVEGERGCLG